MKEKYGQTSKRLKLLWLHREKKNKIHLFRSKLLLLLTSIGSLYYHTYLKQNAGFLRSWWER